MIPSTAGILAADFDIKEQASKTYKMDWDNKVIKGSCDGVEAVKQAIFKIINTERYQYIMYSWNYGVELLDLYGQPITYVCPELERRISEALSADARIISVTDFEHDITQKGKVHTKFIVHTIFGDVQSEKEVNI